jgi:hypothetical protein
MKAKVQKDFTFQSAIHLYDEFMINNFNIDLMISVESDDQREQNVAIERVNYFLLHHIDNCIFVFEDDKKAIDRYEKAGLRVLTLIEEPFDQIIGMVLLRKLNAIMEGKLVVEDIIIHSKLSSDIKFRISVEETEEYAGNYWWNQKSTTTKIASNNKKDKVVKLFDNDWEEIGLVWKDKN